MIGDSFNQKYPDEFIDYLSAFLTENRARQFQQVLTYRTSHISILTEYLYDEQNLYAIVRTAECLGVQHIHVLEQQERLKPAKKVSRGSHKWLSIHHHFYTEDCVDELFNSFKKAGYYLAAAEPGQGGYLPENIPLEKPLLLIFGKEHTGLSQKAKEAANYFLQIPIYGLTESYNVSVAAAICLYSIIQRLHNSNIHWQLDDKEKKFLWHKWILKTVRNPELHYKRWLSEKSTQNQ
ncbi:MAG: RNA methyltransferase [Chitinophagales bacterium]|nr:RNA methyltransferase [Chitinophagales bacterium]MDW8272999.1 RNA methyltransferase [Chitinophagales bacterium]